MSNFEDWKPTNHLVDVRVFTSSKMVSKVQTSSIFILMIFANKFSVITHNSDGS